MKQTLAYLTHSARTVQAHASKRNRFLRTVGYAILRRMRSYETFLPDFTDEDIQIIRAVKPYTATSTDRIYGLLNAVRYIVANNIPGDFVECGVWKGGSAMTMIKTLQQLRAPEREVHLFDTFAGMTAPTDKDTSQFEPDTVAAYEALKEENGICRWAYASLDEAKRNVLSTGYDPKKIHWIVGRVEDTLPGNTPQQISLLRLDTDFYESTKAELVHLWPRLIPGGVIIVDDYGHWDGVRIAIDEYVAEHKIKLLLNRLDYSGRIGVKL
jgi:O-methyltransferase